MKGKPPGVAFGEAVRAARLRAGISQEALAAEAGLHRTYVGGIERGEQNPSLANIVRLAAALNSTVAALIKDAGI
jgi:transcriptional regulator with XRE-family HTH domain